MNAYDTWRPRKIVVAVKKPFAEWFPFVVHESCHMDQELEKCEVWKDLFVTPRQKDAHDLVFAALEKPEQFDDADLRDFLMRVVAVERDCEERTVAKIRLWNLPLDENTYVRRTNSYLWFHTMLPKLRSWYPAGKEPYNNAAVWGLCPDHFDNDYDVVPRQLEESYVRYCS